jgi:hypothetical protein
MLDEAEMAKGLPGASQWTDLSRTPGAIFTKYPMLTLVKGKGEFSKVVHR